MNGPTDRDRDRKSRGDSLSDLENFDRDFDMNEAVVAPKSSGTDVDQKYVDVLEVSALLNSTLNLTELLNNVVDGIVRMTRCERGFLMLKGEDGSFSLHIGRTKDKAEWNRDHLAISRTIVDRIVETREMFVEHDLQKVDDMKSGSIIEHSIRSAICLPLLYEEDLIGVIYADSQFVVPAVLDSDHTILKAFAAQAALAIENARQHGELRTRRDLLEEQNLLLRQQLSKEFVFAGMVSKNKSMLEVFDTVEKIAEHDINVMVHGESGTGKELLARAIHEKSPRCDHPFETVNCAGIPAGLVESILFGHKKGAFTGAVNDKPGVFELADGGTLFLDEIGDMPLEIQPKILRAVQEGEIRRLGEEDRVRTVDVRIISATHMDLTKAVKEGRFRQDLFFRLNVGQVTLPPLRDRREDIVPLADFFLKKFSQDKNKPLASLSRGAQELLISNRWVGNVRELKSAIEWGIVFQDDRHVIHDRDLEKFFKRSDETAVAASAEVGGSLRGQLARYEEQLIRQTLSQHDFNVTLSAKVLDISRQQLHNKIKKFKIVTRIAQT